VPQAKRESFIANIQYLFVCLIVGFSVKQIVILNEEEKRHQSYMIQWIYVDCIIIILQRYYLYVCQAMMINGEIMKNIYTLNFTQKKILEKRKKDKMMEINTTVAEKIFDIMKLSIPLGNKI
jgi:hypothetical protein